MSTQISDSQSEALNFIRPLNRLESGMANLHTNFSGTTQFTLILEVEGKLEPSRVERALQIIQKQYEALASKILLQESQWHLVKSSLSFPIIFTVITVPELPSNDVRCFDELLEREVNDPLDIHQQLCRLTMLSQDNFNRHLLILTLAHVIADATAGLKIFSEILRLSTQNFSDKTIDRNISPENAGFSSANKTGHSYPDYQQAVKMWSNPARETQTASYTAIIEAETVEKLSSIASRHNLTMNSLLTALIQQTNTDFFKLDSFPILTAINCHPILNIEDSFTCLIQQAITTISGDIYTSAQQIKQDILDAKATVAANKMLSPITLQNLQKDLVFIYTNNGRINKITVPPNFKLHNFRTGANMNSGTLTATFHLAFLNGCLILCLSYYTKILQRKIISQLMERIARQLTNFAIKEY